jgi:hypothetical protein
MSIKSLDLASNDLDDIESANILRELIRRNKTITGLSVFLVIPLVALVAIPPLLRPFLQQLGLRECGLGDQGLSLLASALAILLFGTPVY